MVAEAVFLRERHDNKKTAVAAIAGGEVHQLSSGLAGVKSGLNAAATNDVVHFKTDGKYTFIKPTGWVGLKGQEVFWDHSANNVTYQALSDKDFFLGVLVEDCATGDTSCVVDLNVHAEYIIDLNRSAFNHIPVLTAGTPISRMVGGTLRSEFSLTAEAQKLDLASVRTFPIGSNWILEAVVNVVTNADADVGDLNVGVANATHASDADAITESCFFHWDMGADLNLDAESDDGTTEVNATDTTIDWAVGTPVHLMIDGRTPSDIQMYVNGALVLGSTTFTLNAGTGPLKALFHLEKSANDSPGVVELHKLTVRIAEQD